MKIFGLVGWSGSGKTTLLVKLLPELVARNVRVSTMKHAHHTFDASWNYRFNDDNTRVFLAVYNVTDEEPPFARLDLNYDPYTHNPYGRMIKFGVQHDFAGLFE